MNEITPPTLSHSMPNYIELGGTVFEKMCRELLGDSAHLYGLNGQADYGVDIVEYKPDGEIIVYQCKCCKIFPPNEIDKVVKIFLNHWENHWKKCHIKEFILFVACDVANTKIQNKIITYNRDEFKQKNIVFTVNGPAQITDILKYKPDVVRRYFDESWVNTLSAYNFNSLNNYVPLKNSSNNNITSQLQEEYIEPIIKKEIEEIKKIHKQGDYLDALNQLESKIINHQIFATLADRVKAQAYRFKIDLLLQDAAENLQEAKNILQILYDLEDETEDNKLMGALIILHEQGADATLKELHSLHTINSQLLKTKILIGADQFTEAENILKLLDATKDKGEHAYEILFVKAWLYINQGKIAQAETALLAIPQEKRQNNLILKQLHAQILFYSVLPVPASHVTRMAPFACAPELVKTDSESQQKLDKAYRIFKEIVTSQNEVASEFFWQAWVLACLGSMAGRSDEMGQYIDELLADSPAHQIALAWGHARGFISTTEAIARLEKDISDGDELKYQLLYNLYCENNQIDKAEEFYNMHRDKIQNFPDDIILVNKIITTHKEFTEADFVEIEKRADNIYESDKQFFVNICQFLLSKNRADYVYANQKKLFTIAQTAKMVEMIAKAYYQLGKYKELQGFVKQYKSLFPNQEYSLYMQRIIISAMFTDLDFLSAKSEATQLAHKTREIIDINNLIIIQLSSGNHTDAIQTYQLFEADIQAQGNLPVETSVRLASYAIGINREFAKKILQNLPTDNFPVELLHPIMQLKQQLGLNAEDSERQLVQEIKKGNVPNVIFIETREEFEQARKINEQIFQNYIDGKIAIHHLGLSDFVGIFSVSLKKNNLISNNIAAPLMVRHGSRPIYSEQDYNQLAPNDWNIYIDITSLILAWQMGLLEKVAQHYPSISIAHFTIMQLNNIPHKDIQQLYQYLMGNRDKYNFLPKVPQETQEDDALLPAFTELIYSCVERDDNNSIIWCDDRFMSTLASMPRLPFGTYDILKAMQHDNKITQGEYYHYLLELRKKNLYFIPAEADEIIHHLQQTIIENNTLQETEPLIILRKYFARCFIENSGLQCAQLEENQKVETQFIVQHHYMIREVFAKIFNGNKTKEEKFICANWVLHHLFFWQYPVAQRYFNKEQFIYISISRQTGNPDYKDWVFTNFIVPFMNAYPAKMNGFYEILHQTCQAALVELRQKLPNSSKKDIVIAVFNENIYKPFHEKIILELSKKSWYHQMFAELTIEHRMIKIDNFIFSFKESIQVFANAFKPNNNHLSITANDGTVFTVEGQDNDNIILHNQPKDLHLQYSHVTNRILLPSTKRRKDALTQDAYLWDVPNKQTDTFFNKIAKTPDIYKRYNALENQLFNSCSIKYHELARMQENEKIIMPDLLPPSAEAMQNFLHVENTKDAPDIRQIASHLIEEVGMEEALRRLSGLPIALSTLVGTQLAELQAGERKRLLNRWCNDNVTPLKFFHILAMDRQYQFSNHQNDFLKAFIEKQFQQYHLERRTETFLKFLKYTDSMFNRMEGLQDWHEDLRLIAAWIHTHQIMSIFNTDSPEELNEFTKIIENQTNIPLNVYYFPYQNMSAITPVKLSKEQFIPCGLHYVLGDTASSLLSDAMLKIIRDLSTISDADGNIMLKSGVIPLSTSDNHLESFIIDDISMIFRNLQQSNIVQLLETQQQNFTSESEPLDIIKQYDFIVLMQDNPFQCFYMFLSIYNDSRCHDNEEMKDYLINQYYMIIDNTDIANSDPAKKEHIVVICFHIALLIFYHSNKDATLFEALTDRLISQFPAHLNRLHNDVTTICYYQPLEEDEELLLWQLLTKIRAII